MLSLVLAALLAPFPPAGREIDALTDLTHVPLFAAAAGLAAWWLLRRGFSLLAAAALGWLFSAALGLGVEVLQALVGREASKADLWADLGGASAGVLAVIGSAGRGPRRAALWALGGLAALAGAGWPLLRLADVVRQRLHPARLATFEDALELDRWSFDGSRAQRSREHATQGRFALRIELRPGRYPGAGLTSPPPDWSAYARFACDVFVEGEEPLELRVKVEDEQHDRRLADRFQRVVRLPPGPSRLEIDLADVERGPQGRRLDLTRVAELRFFAVDLGSPRAFFLDGLTLSER